MPITEIEGRRLTLTHLDRILYPQAGTVKGQLVHYYATIAPVLLPHVHGRPVSFLRAPNGVDGKSFFAKRPPAGTPTWVTTAVTELAHHEEMEQVQINDLATLVWAANLACIELHVPQWKAARPGIADRLVLDLDPGEDRTIVDCCRVALLLRERMRADGLESWAKTTGSKGLHVYASLTGASPEQASAYAKALARELEGDHPDLVVSKMSRTLRAEKIFIDWSQNAAAKTTAAPYTVRARATPTVSTPVSWDEIEECGEPTQLSFTIDDVPDRVTAHGDLLAPLLNRDQAGTLPS
ncbi:non-homologous end-joining DNA ligase [Streptomyces sp. H10-C2]|uniref:non-homologous end-joining DNA ligase n=1 Tax=unclassified Streptomyces TaxID=2593676 RepID=UPI0024BB4C0F|nr:MULTISPECIES: non-homologous end-joining DNA ligase [unclassified Streptomyces]MDJ0342151.1 non-homologous end-joining DNA ligase [Streptomyces sp. PH10-H1]MDJ0368665.1 non-homologous end-joining DNA ligase [Streptomyces sp. H10-C2]